VAKPDLGTKRLCGSCGAKFYDLDRTPIVCPKCETVFVVPVVTSRARAEAAQPKPAVAEKPEVETTDAELVSLEDADAEQQGKKKPAKGAEDGDDVEIEEDQMDDAAFIEEEEEGSDDVTDIIGDGIEKEEES
jgi:uncharacterized protein (TIGR02300 family)